MKEVFSFQEIAPLFDQGGSASFTRHIVAHVSVSQPSPDSETVNAVVLLSLGAYNIGICEVEYADLLETFDIDDKEEIWEVEA